MLSHCPCQIFLSFWSAVSLALSLSVSISESFSALLCLHLSVSASFFFCLSGFLLVSVSLCLCLTTHHPQPPALCSATPNYWKLPQSATFSHRHGCCVTRFSPFQEHQYLWPLPKFLPALFILRSEFIQWLACNKHSIDSIVMISSLPSHLTLHDLSYSPIPCCKFHNHKRKRCKGRKNSQGPSMCLPYLLCAYALL